MRTVNIGFLGMGNVGMGTYRILTDNADVITHREGIAYRVKYALVHNLSKVREGIPQHILTDDAEKIFSDPEIEIVAEFLGGIEPARTYILRALSCGKTVVTANKIVLAECWPELEECAKANNVGLYYEASVAGGIPIIRAVHDSMQGNRINKMMGIINGTTNYILSAMSNEGKSYADVLKTAQGMGLAEANPSLDVEGRDAAYKLSLLASIAFHAKTPWQKVYCEGITKITQQDIAIGKELGLTLKLLAIGKKVGKTLEVRVHPTFIPSTHPLATVSGATNAIYLYCDALGELMLSGQGAGGLPTGSAVVSDIIYASQQTKHKYNTFRNTTNDENDVSFNTNWESEYYVAVSAPDRPGVMAAITRIFADNGISIASMMQKRNNDNHVPLIFLTHICHELSLCKAVEEIEQLPDVSVTSTIRAEAI